jgi:hypothetical protein
VLVLVHFSAALALILIRSPLAWVLLAQAGAWNAGLLGSPNLNDYITDAPLLFISAAMLSARVLDKIKLRKQAAV